MNVRFHGKLCKKQHNKNGDTSCTCVIGFCWTLMTLACLHPEPSWTCDDPRLLPWNQIMNVCHLSLDRETRLWQCSVRRITLCTIVVTFILCKHFICYILSSHFMKKRDVLPTCLLIQNNNHTFFKRNMKILYVLRQTDSLS